MPYVLFDKHVKSGKIKQINTVMLINDIITETTSGGIAIVAQPMGKMQKRPNPSVFAKTKKSKKKKSKNRGFVDPK